MGSGKMCDYLEESFNACLKCLFTASTWSLSIPCIDLETLDLTTAWPLRLEMVCLFPKLVSIPRLWRLCHLTVQVQIQQSSEWFLKPLEMNRFCTIDSPFPVEKGLQVDKKQTYYLMAPFWWEIRQEFSFPYNKRGS